MEVRKWFWITVVLFLFSWAGQFLTQVALGTDDPMDFAASTFENWQSEFLQIGWQAIGVVGLIAWRDKRKGLDTDVELHRKVDRLLERTGR